MYLMSRGQEKRNRTIILLIVAAMGGIFYACTNQKPAQTPEKDIAEKLLTQIDSFSAIGARFQQAVETGITDTAVLQRLFLKTRLAYKRIEWAAEYFDPTAARIVNGPPVPEVELSGKVFDPAGLQVMEAFLWPRYDTAHRRDLVLQLQHIQTACTEYKRHFANIDILDWQVFDATKLEVFRIETQGIVGFDDPLSQQSMTEAAESLSGMQEMLVAYLPGKAATAAAGDSLTRLFAAAVRYLTDHPGFDSFDRAVFITDYVNPLTTDLTGLDQRVPVQHIHYNRLLNQEAKTLFDTNAFNVNAYVPDYVSFTTPGKIALGKRLFADPSLSATGTRSCQSCHQPDKAFTDGLVKNTMLENHQLLARNTPTLLNAALQPAQFYDLRVKTLEDQSRTVVQNEAEMHGDMRLSVQWLWKDTVYRRLFTTAFPRKERTGIDTLEVMNAIGSYIRSLVFLDSRFDSYMRGDKTALTLPEVNGFNLFMGKAKCGSCHYMPLFNGTFPPRYMRIETEVIGVPASPAGKVIDGDPGRYAIVKAESFRHAFKTPTVRNAARTAPYMHNGVFATLEQVVDFYDKGGGIGLGMKIENQTLPFDKLELTGKEKAEIVAFIRCLDSK
jgi:cytochrome c peroxidase